MGQEGTDQTEAFLRQQQVAASGAEMTQVRPQGRTQLFSMVAQVANLLLKSSDYAAVLLDVVRLLGEAVGSDRCGIGQKIPHPTSGKPAVRIMPERCRTEILSSEEFSPHVDQLFLWKQDAPFIDQQLDQGKVVNCLVSELPDPDHSLLAAQGNTAELFVLNAELVKAIERLQTGDRLLEVTAMAANSLL